MTEPVSKEVFRLCEMLLEVAGIGTTRIAPARKHARILQQAKHYMTPEQKSIAQARIDALQTKWGPLLKKPGEVNCKSAEIWENLPEKKIADWLSKRKNPKRLLNIVARAAEAIWEGENRLMDIMERAYEGETDRLIHLVGRDSFAEWLLELRIGVPEKITARRVEWRPGKLCKALKDRNDPLYERVLALGKKNKKGM